MTGVNWLAAIAHLLTSAYVIMGGAGIVISLWGIWRALYAPPRLLAWSRARTAKLGDIDALVAEVGEMKKDILLDNAKTRALVEAAPADVKKDYVLGVLGAIASEGARVTQKLACIDNRLDELLQEEEPEDEVAEPEDEVAAEAEGWLVECPYCRESWCSASAGEEGLAAQRAHDLACEKHPIRALLGERKLFTVTESPRRTGGSEGGSDIWTVAIDGQRYSFHAGSAWHVAFAASLAGDILAGLGPLVTSDTWVWSITWVYRVESEESNVQ